MPEITFTENTPAAETESAEVPKVTEAHESETERETETSASLKEILSPEALKWVECNMTPDEVIMTPHEIAAENGRLLDLCSELTDIYSFPESLDGEEVRKAVSARSSLRGQGPWYDRDGSEISADHIEERKDSCAVDLIPDSVNVVRGIAVERGHLRSFPDEKPYFASANSKYDTLQYTEIKVGTPLAVIHMSKDGEYCFAVSYNYSGWIKAESVALTDDASLWELFSAADSFVCVTDAMVKVGEAEADMGTRLPLKGKTDKSFIVTLPLRSEDGTLSTTEEKLPLSSASVGYLPYTFENYISQAFKYEGTPYGWGGLDGGVDCSGFITNVMATFGFALPRDTGHQESKVGRPVQMTGKEHGEISAFLDGISKPTAVYYPGHVLFYLGKDEANGKYCFIHAPQIGESVSVTYKENLAGITYICTFAEESK